MQDEHKLLSKPLTENILYLVSVLINSVWIDELSDRKVYVKKMAASNSLHFLLMTILTLTAF